MTRATAARISLLMPCRNAGAFLPEAIASITAQTLAGFRCIAINDGSADNTGELLEQWAARDQRVHVIHSPAHGLVRALETARAHADTELVARMDADDLAHPSRLERQLAFLDAHADIAACGTQVRYFPRASVRDGALRYEQWINGLIEASEIERDIFVECPLPHPTLMIRRHVLAEIGGYQDHGWPEDYDLLLRLWAAGFRMGKVAQVLLEWREGNDRSSRRDARYDEAAFRRCKLHYLARTLLVDCEGVVIWGAGPVGKAVARELAMLGVVIRAFVELDRRKIGQTIHGAPVIAPAEVNQFRGAFALAAVAGEVARGQIRAALQQAGWREMREFCAVA